MWRHRRTQMGILGALVAVLLPAGVLSISLLSIGKADEPAPAAGRRVGVAAVARSALAEEPTTTSTTRGTVAPTTTAVSPSTTTSTRPTPSTTTTTIRATTTTTAVAPAAGWRGEHDGVSARLRVEPAAPVAGQPVRFVIDVSSPGACCVIFLRFGDTSEDFAQNNGRLCAEPSPYSPGPRTATVSHTYAAAGVYQLLLTVMDSDPCALMAGVTPGLSPPLAKPLIVNVDACIAVGPGPACPTLR